LSKKIHLATRWEICYIVIEIGKAREAATLVNGYMTLNQVTAVTIAGSGGYLFPLKIA
jgi:hypothetical protein